MACINPVTINGVSGLPCGKCPKCLSRRASEWALRCQHEMAFHEDNCFLTLTYDDNPNNDDRTQTYYDVQIFLKKLRRLAKKKISFLSSIEYGGKSGRLHYHFIIFGYYPKHPQLLKYTEKGYPLYHEPSIPTSRTLADIWPYGFHSFAVATGGSAYYIANYSLKNNHFVTNDGEILSDSLKCSHGIGLRYFHKYFENLIAESFFTKIPIPRYYKKKLEEFYPNHYDYYVDRWNEIDYQLESDPEAVLKEIKSKTDMSQSNFRENKSFDDELNYVKNIKRYKRGMSPRFN